MLTLIVSFDSESTGVTVSTSPTVDISTVLCESTRFFTLRRAFCYVALN